MPPARVQIVGEGWRVDKSQGHPAGTIFSGGYDSQSNTVFAAGEAGHPGGVRAAGGDPTRLGVSGLRIIRLPAGDVFWADDSMSLPRKFEPEELEAVQQGLELFFQGSRVTKVARFSEISDPA
jgi:hypothetical protein